MNIKKNWKMRVENGAGVRHVLPNLNSHLFFLHFTAAVIGFIGIGFEIKIDIH